MNYDKRKDRIVKLLEFRNLDALLIQKRENISYLTGVRGEESLLIQSSRKSLLITDPRYREAYARNIRGSALQIVDLKERYEAVKSFIKKNRFKKIGFEAEGFSYQAYKMLKDKLKDVSFFALDGPVESLRMIKDRDEIKLIRQACHDGCRVMSYGLRVLRCGVTEEDIKKKINLYTIKVTNNSSAFDIIVTSGLNSSQPHAAATRQKIKNNRMVVIDLGTINYGYNSDLTRTSFLGKIDRKFSRIYKIIKDAQRMAIEKIRPGIQAGTLDAISRQYIIRKGLGNYFIHSLGHGIGLEAHEMPYISKGSKVVLQEGMTFTIEPGIYISGWGGVRIEDVVLVTKEGCEVLTSAVKK